MILQDVCELGQPPKKIVSLVPSQTELLHALELHEEVVGITKFCIHPANWAGTKEKIGGTKNLNIDKIRFLSPDLIIANKEENLRDQVENLATDFNVWVTDVADLGSALKMIADIGRLTGRQKQAAAISDQIQKEFSAWQTEINSSQTHKQKAAYLIWKEPYMVAGGDCFINAMLYHAGFSNVFFKLRRYPVVTIKDLEQSGSEIILLSSEPYPFRQRHIAELQALLPDVRILLADGEMFSWYGSRLMQAPGYFRELHRAVDKTGEARRPY